jgi:hypothetical protein
MGTGVPAQALKAAEEAERLYQEQIDVLAGNTGSTGETGEIEAEATGPTGEAEVVSEETPEQKAEKIQHKYDVLRGMYNKEIPELSLRLAEQSGQIKSLTDQIAALIAGKKPDETKEVFDSFEQDPNIGYLKTEYPEVWKGIEVALVKLRDETSKKISDLGSQLTEQKKHTEKTDRDRFYDDVESMENYDEINKSVEFNSWLDETEPLTGFKRRDILNDAYASLDSTRAKNFFSEFTGKKVEPVVVKQVVKKEDTGISPRTTVTKTVVDKSELKENFIKASDVKKFYDDVQRGRYKGRDAEKDKIEAEINKAISDKRVIAGQ